MIGRLRGELISTEGGVVLLEVAGVGYEVTVPLSVVVQLAPLGEEAILIVRQIFREDGVSLYGFATSFQRRLFDLLLSVKGCGPKVAVSLIGSLGEDEVVNAVQLEDARTLTRAPGVGARIAERIVLELKDKLMEEAALRRVETLRTGKATPSDELVEALIGLGFRRIEAENAAASARNEAEGLQEQLLVALKSLQKVTHAS